MKDRVCGVLGLAMLLGAIALPVTLPAQEAEVKTMPARPIPYPMILPPQFLRAVDNGTRTTTGQPGEQYWTQRANYRIEAEVDPETPRLDGTSVVTYFNRSPQPLPGLVVHLRHNLFRQEALKNQSVPETGGVTLGRVAAGGQELQAMEGQPSRNTGPGYRVNGTVMQMVLPQPLASGDSVTLEFAWSMDLPPDGAPRQGKSGNVLYVAYWYPQLAVYDDLSGWVADQYLANAEFYMGYGDYQVSLTVPAGWLVAATGSLDNPEEVLSETTRERLSQARNSGEVVRVVTEAERGAGTATTVGSEGKLTWRFSAENVRDFAFGLSNEYLWDAAIAVVGDIDGDSQPDTADVYSFYRPSAATWDRAAEFGKHSIEFLSSYLWPYPYPHMTSVDGPNSCGGMEYPMITCIGGNQNVQSLYGVTVHEYAHMWFPMQVGSNEKRHAWMDEGLTQFNGYQGEQDFFGQSSESQFARFVLQYLASGQEIELMRHGDYYPTGISYGVASYFKPARALMALREMLGEETFLAAYREYGSRWLGKHPTPYDMWNTFEDVSGRDLDWFWRSWFYERWPLDQAVAEVRAEGDSTVIVIEDRGLLPMPVPLKIVRQDGSEEELVLPVEPWLAGEWRQSVTVAGTVTEVSIDPRRAFADVDWGNNDWKP